MPQAIPIIALAIAAAGTGYTVSENEAAKDDAKKQRRKQEADAAKAKADLEAKEKAAKDKEIQTAISAASRAQATTEYNPSGIQGTLTAANPVATPELSAVIGQTSANSGQRTLIGG